MTSAPGSTARAGLLRRLAALQEERRELDERIVAVTAAIDRLDGAPRTCAAAGARSALPSRDGRRPEVPTPRARGWATFDASRREAVLAEHELLARAWARTHAAGEPAEGPAAQDLARRHRDWLSSALDMPAGVEDVLAARDVLAADPHAAREYDRHGEGVAAYVRDALAELAARTGPGGPGCRSRA